MKCFAITVTALVAFSAPAAAADCVKDYKGFWDQFNNAKSLSGHQHAIVSRQALRAFDACSAGDEASAKSIFASIQDAAPAKGDDYWKQLQETAPAKK